MPSGSRSGPSWLRARRVLVFVLVAAALSATAVLAIALPSAHAARVRESALQRAALVRHASDDRSVETPDRDDTAASGSEGETAAASAVQERRRPFRHAQHEPVECASCHDMERAHGRVTITAPRDCDQCHHRDTAPETCVRCHTTSANAGQSYPRAGNMNVAGRTLTRELSFDHGEHTEIACASCHTVALTMAVPAEPCAGCHVDHHETVRECAACHQAPAPDAHPVSVHLTCTGAGCHGAGFLTGDPRARQVCLSCHREQADHRPGEPCMDCHLLPPWRG